LGDLIIIRNGAKTISLQTLFGRLNDDEISICEVEYQTHDDDADSVATLIESCETEPSCSSSITDSTNNFKIQSWMKIIQHSLSRIWEGLVHLSMSKVLPGYIIVVLNQDICVNIVNFFKKRFSNRCTQIRLYYRLFQMYANFFTWWISSLPRLPLWEGGFHIWIWLKLLCQALRSRFTQRNLEGLMRISIEGKDKLSDSDLDTLVNKFKNKKDKYMML
jgi:hypothetical protein